MLIENRGMISYSRDANIATGFRTKHSDKMNFNFLREMELTDFIKRIFRKYA